MRRPPRTELEHHLEVARWLKTRKDRVPIFRTDYAAGLKLTIGQAKIQHRLQSGRAYPDLFIPKPVGEFHGLYLELKKPEETVILKDGTITKDKHIREQLQVLVDLFHLGYGAAMVRGHKEAKQAIEDYLNGRPVFPTRYLLPEAPADLKLEPEDELPF